MSDTATRRQAEQALDERSWLDAEVDGRSVRFWIVTGLAIAAVTLGVGAFLVWGVDGPMATDGMADAGEMPDTDVRLPPVAGLYDGEEIFFVHPEASDPDVAGMGPFGFQPDVFASAPGDDGYSPLRTVVLVSWGDEGRARVLRSAAEVTAAADAGEVTLEETDVVVNMPFLTWPEGGR